MVEVEQFVPNEESRIESEVVIRTLSKEFIVIRERGKKELEVYQRETGDEAKKTRLA